jgi:predicted MPP superfamily phosphohydrolase
MSAAQLAPGARGPSREAGRTRAPLALLSLLLFVALGVDAMWIEPRVLLVEDAVRIPLAAGPLRLVHLSDLHISADAPLLHRLLARVAAAAPDLIAVSGDFIKDEASPRLEAHTAAAAAFVSQLRRLAPVYAVQGHSDYQGEEIAALHRAGLTWLSNEGRLVGPGLLLLGVNQQVGTDRLTREWPSPFRAVRQGGQWLHAAAQRDDYRNFYNHYDPAPASLADASGPLGWSGYDAVCDLSIDGPDVGAGIEVHSRYVLGEDRMIRLRRAPPEGNDPGTFQLMEHGSAFSGGGGNGGGEPRLDTGVKPQAGRWYRLRLHTEVEPGVVRAKARVWPSEEPEPRIWQAWAEDRSPDRVEAGTVGLWAWGGGTVLYRNLKVTAADGRLLLDDPLAGAERPHGWRDGARGTRLEMALARSPAVPAGTPRLVLSHTPDIVLEASQRGIDAVLAGHTHGGQVRLPAVGALTTRNSLGSYFDLGLFDFAAPNRRGLTSLYINAGVGTSILPMRFLCPPRFAVVELGRGTQRR